MVREKQLAAMGVDPGGSGAAIVLAENRKVIARLPFQNKRYETFWRVGELLWYYDIRALLEDVHSQLGDSMQSVFVFGMNTGFARDLVELYKIPHEFISPMNWKKRYRLLKKSKNAAKPVAQELFDGEKITLDTMDAWLLADLQWRIMFEDLKVEYAKRP